MKNIIEFAKARKSELIKGTAVIVGSTAGLVIGLGVLDQMRNPTDEDALDTDAVDADYTDTTTETD